MIAAVPASLTSLSPPTPAKLGTLKQKGVLLFMAGNTAKDKRDLYPQLINDYGFSKVVGKHTRGVDLILCYPDAASLDKLEEAIKCHCHDVQVTCDKLHGFATTGSWS